MDSVAKKTLVYYSGAILFSWSFWIGTMAYSQLTGVDILYNEGFYEVLTGGVKTFQQFLVFLLFTAAAYGPLFGMFLAAGLLKKQNVQDTHQPNIGRWLLFIFLYPIILFSAALLVTWIAMGFAMDFNWPVLPLWFFPVFFLFQCLTSGVEEFGWRGYLQPLLQTRMTAEKACFRVGVLWSIWHYPVIVYMNYPQGTLVILLTLAGFTMLTIPQAYVIGWLYNSTRKVWLCVVLHAWANTVSAYLLAASPVPMLTPIAVAIGAWLLANYLVKKYGKETLSTQTG
ncbi:membrane protease YdiL (CAAX protease family) [Planomicrobium stackebrandtii]|uniref:Membrane protease YdiL (CAAX protease family) n=1 Tax=Planomicrobium stackebrandtii TaxID=253160 RepID=A0ABU0GTY1_9BACL|nr:CPBP family intramembrane glutamic endopeptidase [Planomicrobium stackebrandtii]MDQ0428820.1 membrane protease YdiL (CAAX protease family) [Planomicrobium stackebrandtii]